MEEYNRTHARVDARNVDEFNKRRLTDLLQLKHITFIFPFEFRAQEITCMNKLESIYFDCSHSSGDIFDRTFTMSEWKRETKLREEDQEEWYRQVFYMRPTPTNQVLEQVLAANNKTLKRLVVRVVGEHKQLYCELSCGLGVPKWRELPCGVVYWVWEWAGRDDGALVWNEGKFVEARMAFEAGVFDGC